MSILIKGMAMPKYGCDHCFLRTGNYCGRIEKDESVVEYARKNERHPDCPLVEIPPHGDLIDRKQLIKSDHQHYEYLSDEFYITVRDIEAAPTIIPADRKDGAE